MFSVGQKVWHRRGKVSGTVLECDGDRVFIARENGAEVDFPASELSAVPPEGGEAPVAVVGRGETVTQVIANRVITPRDITPEHEKVLASVPMRTMQAVAVLYERRTKNRKFSALDVAAKLNVLTEITAVPYRVMRTYLGRPGELGLLMGKGLADSQREG
jgi:hypothetical protein